MTPEPDFLDHAGRLAAEPARQRRRIKAAAMVDVDEVQPDRGVADAHLARTGLADLDLLPVQNLGSAGLVKRIACVMALLPHCC